MRSVLVVVLLAGVASAQPGAMQPVPVGAAEPIPTPPSRPEPEPELLSENTALWLSLGGTLGSYTLWGLAQGVSNERLGGTLLLTGALGTMFAPSFGHWYAGKFLTRGLGARAAGMGTALVGLVVIFSCGGILSSHSDENCDLEIGAGVSLMLAATGLWVYGTFDDIIQAPRRVARINEARLSMTYALVPTANHESIGFALAGRF